MALDKRTPWTSINIFHNHNMYNTLPRCCPLLPGAARLPRCSLVAQEGQYPRRSDTVMARIERQASSSGRYATKDTNLLPLPDSGRFFGYLVLSARGNSQEPLATCIAETETFYAASYITHSRPSSERCLLLSCAVSDVLATRTAFILLTASVYPGVEENVVTETREKGIGCASGLGGRLGCL
jgi:hypothetical protein